LNAASPRNAVNAMHPIMVLPPVPDQDASGLLRPFTRFDEEV
jgi:hypothetical protein